MGYLFLTVTVVVSGFALRFWLSFFAKRVNRFKHSVEVSDLPMQEADLVGMFLPRPARRVWNFIVLTVCFLLLGVPHHLVIWNFWRQREIDPWLYVHYAWTLAYWVAVLAAYAFIIARDRESRTRQLPSGG